MLRSNVHVDPNLHKSIQLLRIHHLPGIDKPTDVAGSLLATVGYQPVKLAHVSYEDI